MVADSGLGKKRVIVAVLLLAWVLAGLFYGGFILASFLALFVFIGTREFVEIARNRGMNPPFYFTVGAAFALLGIASLKEYSLLFGTFVFFAVAAFLIILFRGVKARVNDLAITMLALVYTGVFPLHMLMIRDFDARSFSVFGYEFNIGIGLVIMMFLTVAACDIGAFYSGKFFGKHALWKEVSPKKTKEGSIGGTVAGILVSVIVGCIIGLNIVISLMTGILVSLFAQLGDLVESMIKREAGIKDSGTLFPGHGGVLDRSDSYIITVVAAYYYFKYFVVNNIFATFSFTI